MDIKSQVEIEDMNYSEREQTQNHKEKKEISAKPQKIEGQPDHAFRVCKGKDISGGDLNFSGDIRFKGLNGNISSLLCTESMEILLIDVHNVIKEGEIQASAAVTLKEPFSLLFKDTLGMAQSRGIFNQKEEIQADVDPSKLPSLGSLPFPNGINCCCFGSVP